MLLRLFNASLQRRPLTTQIIASGVICAGGDVMSQFIFEKRTLQQYDLLRTGRFFILGSCFITPIVARWFKFLEANVNYGSKKFIPLSRVFCDQLFMAPPLNAAILVVLRQLEGYSFNESIEKMKQDWWPVYSRSLMLWPFVQTINFYFVPLNMRVIVVQLVALFWNSWLSYKTQAKLPH